jgi:hypothetical protein
MLPQNKDRGPGNPSSFPVVAVINPANVIAGGAASVGTYNELIKTRHPQWIAQHSNWEKYRLTYESGDPFIKTYLKRYKRETDEDFNWRLFLAYNPNHAGAIVDNVRNALAVKMPDVAREGSETYLDIIRYNVDRKGSSMSAFVATQLLPDLLSLGGVGVWIDAPAKAANETAADDAEKTPFLFVVHRENMLSWTKCPESGHLLTILIKEWMPSIDKYGLTSGLTVRYRYAQLLPNNGGVRVVLLDKIGTVVSDVTLVLPCIPYVFFEIAQPLMTDIANMQVALLNLNSEDTSFLCAANFPIWTQQYDPKMDMREKYTQLAHDGSVESAKDLKLLMALNEQVHSHQRGIKYAVGTERPSWISPSSANVEISIKKQERMIQDMRLITQTALTSLSVSALQQSGASKEADRIGEEAALAYIASVLESGENSIAEIMASLMGDDPTQTGITYPRTFNVHTDSEVRAEAKELSTLRSQVQSATYYKTMSKAIARTLLNGKATPEELTSIEKEIDELKYWDTDIERAKTLVQYVLNKLVTAQTASKLAGFGPEEAVAALQQQNEDVNRMLGNIANGGAPVDVNTAEQAAADLEAEGQTPNTDAAPITE